MGTMNTFKSLFRGSGAVTLGFNSTESETDEFKLQTLFHTSAQLPGHSSRREAQAVFLFRKVTAPLSAQDVNENHVLSDANHR